MPLAEAAALIPDQPSRSPKHPLAQTISLRKCPPSFECCLYKHDEIFAGSQHAYEKTATETHHNRQIPTKSPLPVLMAPIILVQRTERADDPSFFPTSCCVSEKSKQVQTAEGTPAPTNTAKASPRRFSNTPMRKHRHPRPFRPILGRRAPAAARPHPRLIPGDAPATEVALVCPHRRARECGVAFAKEQLPARAWPLTAGQRARPTIRGLFDDHAAARSRNAWLVVERCPKILTLNT